MKKVAVLIETDRRNDYHYIGVFKDFMSALNHVLFLLREDNATITNTETDVENDIVHLYVSKSWDYDIFVNQEVQVW